MSLESKIENPSSTSAGTSRSGLTCSKSAMVLPLPMPIGVVASNAMPFSRIAILFFCA